MLKKTVLAVLLGAATLVTVPVVDTTGQDQAANDFIFCRIAPKLPLCRP